MPHDRQRDSTHSGPGCLLLAASLVAVLGLGKTQPARLLADEPAAANFFVATDGNNSWSGKLGAPNAQRSDGPFATIERARDAVRQGGGGKAKRCPRGEIAGASPTSLRPVPGSRNPS